MTRLRAGALAAGLLALMSGRAEAQAVYEQFQFELSFSTPGARAKAMGDTLTAAGTDASNAEVNPAGLARKELGGCSESLDISSLRSITYRASTVDAFATGERHPFGDRVNGPSFAGVVCRSEKVGAIGAFYSRFLQYEETFDLPRRSVPGTQSYFLATDGASSLKGETFGLSFAREINESVLLGASLRMSRLGMDITTRRRDIINPESVTNIQNIDDSDWAPSVVLGAVLRPFKAKAKRLGVSWAYNPAFKLAESFDSIGPNGERTPVAGYPRTLVLNVPDRVAVGYAQTWGRGASASQVTAEADLIFERYSELGGRNSTLLPDLPGFPRSDFTVRNVWSPRAGVEWRHSRLALLAGVRLVPSHSFRYTGDTSSTAGRALDYAFNAAAQGTVVGWSGGASYSLTSPKISLGAAFRWTPKRNSEATISLALGSR